TCPHYLVLTSKDMKKYGTHVKVSPPLGSIADQQHLWEGLNDGTVDIIATDHSPFPSWEKNVDIWEACGGIPNFQTTLRLLLTEVNKRKISLQKLVKVTSERVAEIFGLFPRKGSIQIGSDADFTIVDLKKEEKIERDKLYTRAKGMVPFVGWKVKGAPVQTIVRGKVVMNNNEILVKPGFGEFVRPNLHLIQKSPRKLN
ncbi:dihydroorotase family protein, partial [Candidatus Pacearchaeota archaeon]|nr:dihydroorotase family protein [Candidatus Pacearchaeota archaeon]